MNTHPIRTLSALRRSKLWFREGEPPFPPTALSHEAMTELFVEISVRATLVASWHGFSQDQQALESDQRSEEPLHINMVSGATCHRPGCLASPHLTKALGSTSNNQANEPNDPYRYL